MQPAVLVYDPDGMLPSTFAYDAGLGDAVLVARAQDAHRLAEHATVVVLVAGNDNAAGLGLLASLGELRDRLLVLFATGARRHRRLVIRAIRRGATVLIDQTPDALVACVGSLVLPCTVGLHGGFSERPTLLVGAGRTGDPVLMPIV